jgi:rieske iron-sulfur protein
MKISKGGVDRQFQCGRGIERRVALGLGICFTLAPGLAFAQADPTRERPREGDLLVAVDATAPQPLTPEDVPLGAKPVMAWPMDPESNTVRSGSRLNKVLLLRLDPEGFDAETKDHAADGIIAYSAVCTHAGCDVVSWHPDQHLLECPCHNSVYDPTAGGKVVSGPAPRRLPALPVKVVDRRFVEPSLSPAGPGSNKCSPQNQERRGAG